MGSLFKSGNILITGSAGALGSEILRLLQIKNLSNSQIHVINRNNFSKNVINHNFDITNSKKLSTLINDIQPVLLLHLAAKFQGNLDELISVNFTPSLNMLENIYKLKVNTRVLLIGSAAEYGLSNLEIKEKFYESSKLSPITPYGISKSYQCKLLEYYNKLGVDIVYLRIFNLYGDRNSNILFDGALRNKILNYKDGKLKKIVVDNVKHYRDFISINNASKMILQLVEKGKSGQIYNIGSGNAISLERHMENVLKEFKLSLNDVIILDQDKNISKNMITYSCAEMSKTLSLLNIRN